MRIGFSFVDLAMGGAQILMVRLASGLANRGHQVFYHLYSNQADEAHTSLSLLNALDAFACPVQRPRELLNCNVIQLDGYHSLLRKLPYLYAYDHLVETYHSEYSIQRSGPIYVKNRVAVSRVVQELLKPPSKVIHCGVELADLSDEKNKHYDVAILGRIHPVKQHLLFLKICEQLYQQRSGLSVLIIGGHPTSSSYQQHINSELDRLRSTGIHIHLTGMIPPEDVYSWMAKVKVLIITSQNEGLGRMALEAMACSVPVVSNPVGGLLEIVHNGENGFFANRDDPASFTRLTSQLLEDESLRQQFGEKGRTFVEEYFSLDTMVEAYERIYQEIAKGNE